jgi:hypothetical protein
MRGLAIVLIFWIGVVPSLVGSFLILAFLAALLPLLYFALTWFAFSFTAFAVFFGRFCLVPLAGFEKHTPTLYRNSTSSKEIEHEHCFAGKIRS